MRMNAKESAEWKSKEWTVGGEASMQDGGSWSSVQCRTFSPVVSC